jgi:5-methylcytosine-specific restriction endonuclease McrA
MALGRLINAAGGRCTYCPRTVDRSDGPRGATIDHVVPRSRGGGDDLANLALACRRCNAEKGDQVAFELRVTAARAARPADD